MNWKNLFRKKQKFTILSVVIPAAYSLYIREKCKPSEHASYGITRQDYAFCIFECEPEFDYIALSERLGALSIITFGKPIKDATKETLEAMRPCGCLINYELN